MAPSLLSSRSTGVCGSSRPSSLGPGHVGDAGQPGQTLPHAVFLLLPSMPYWGASTHPSSLRLSKLSPVIFIHHSPSRKLSVWEAASPQANWICALSPLGHTCGSSPPLRLCPFVLPSLQASLYPVFSVRGSSPRKGGRRLISLILSVPLCSWLPALSYVAPPPTPHSQPRQSSSGWFWKKHGGGRPSLEHSGVGWTQVSSHHSVEGNEQSPN